MGPRPNENQTNRRRNQVHVPQRTGVTFRGTTTVVSSQNEPTIPLLDEEKVDIKSPLFIQHVRRVGKKIAGSPKKSAVVLLLLLVVSYAGTQLPQKKSAVTDIKGASSTAPTEATLERNAKPKFATVVPSGKSIDELGGWTRISPEGRTPVYAYADKLNNVPIRVSQQELPANLSSNDEKATEGVQKLAESFKANQKLTVGSITVFIGTSAKGPQSVIFAKDELLILITSDQKIDNDHWSTYINSLQ
jgi:hypothetical protein